MLKRLFAPAALALGLLAGSASAFDMATMTDEERAAFRDEVRAYLLENPEVLMEAIAVLEDRQAVAEAQADEDLARANADALFNDGFSWVGGNPEGDISLVEFMDYRCTYCKRAFEEVEALVAQDGNIRFILKEFPILGEQSVLSSRFAVAVHQLHGDDAYKNVHDALMQVRGDITADSLVRLAETFGLEPDPILERMTSDEVTRVLEENRLLAQRLNISGTPTFVMDDQMLRGYVPLNVMQQYAASLRADG
ncbi:DsbA family protein [Loktanella sp. IMCC34160]|uniref:DsbA family protein n=1 Tax=Loktanella sp. IMCC34160 TaxID=2510646 RepID=UPI00101D01E5|nr:DsbA family protein [Loktanella sp. IMCC34160]RYG92024.1 DsbA family protein [Loktanella sp. IMCC34160]